MKKFLSLLLALIMTMSLVTISAGATEYEDLTDKDELGPQYEEAVAVLNKIGVITGYDDGSFRPDVELTRGAAAKIIVSLLIGPEAASNLPNNSAPYPDVPANHTFAGVISFCKTKGIISGYGDGTFKPANDLTGYAFAKMLLGALGYDSKLEGFIGTGWTQNVLAIGQYASLFDRLDFKGSEAVSRKDAALLALNTLKATVVEYNQGQTITVTGENTNVVVNGGQVRSYKTSNQEYARNILRHTQNNVDDDWWTVEFAEDHFVDLRLSHDKYNPINDDWGRPSAEWSYKKVSIGKFPLVADKEYTTQVIHDVDTVTPASKVRALELNGFEVDNNTDVCVNGVYTTIREVADIADFTDYGTLVQIYVDDNGADYIRNVVVVKSQLMEVRRVGSDYVSLDLYDDGSDGQIYGFNQEPIDEKVSNVETGDDYYDLLSGLKADDLVVVEPLSTDGGVNYEVGHAYVPETVKGALNGVPDRYGDASHEYSSLSVDVGGTTYMNSLWNKDLTAINPDAVKITKKDVTLTLDRYGYAMLAEDVGETKGWMIVANYRQSIVNGILVTFANGWDEDGNEVSLNIGARAGVTNWVQNATGDTDDVWNRNGLPRIGTVVRYTNDTSSNTAEWELYWNNANGVFDVYRDKNPDGTDYSIAASSSTVTVALENNGGTRTPLQANDIKFIYVTMDESGELDSIEIKKGRTKVENAELYNDKFGYGYGYAQAYVEFGKNNNVIDEDAKVKAVVIKKESNDSSWKNMLYVVDYKGSAMRDANGEMVQGYEVAMMSENGLLDTQTIYAYRTNLQPGNFARYTKSTHDDHPDDFYTLRSYGVTALDTAGRGNAVAKTTIQAIKPANNRLVQVGALGNTRATGGFMISDTYKSDYNTFPEGGNSEYFADNMVNLQGASWLDLSDYTQDIESAKELKDAFDNGKNLITVTLLFNDDTTSDYFRNVYLIIINKVELGKGPGQTTTPSETTGSVTLADKNMGSIASGASLTTFSSTGQTLASFVLNLPAWAAPTAPTSSVPGTTIEYDVKVDGQLWNRGTLLASASTVTADSATQGEITKYTVKDLQVIAPSTNPSAIVGKKVTVEITGVTYNAVKVLYQDANGNEVTNGTANRTKFLTTAAPGTGVIVMNGVANSTLYNVTGATYSVLNALDASGDAVTNVAFTNSADTAKNMYADGDDYVIVQISGLTKADKFSATSKTYDTAAKGLFAAAKIGLIDTNITAPNDTITLQLWEAVAGGTDTQVTDDDTDGLLLAQLETGKTYCIKALVTGNTDHAGYTFDVKVTGGATASATTGTTMISNSDSITTGYFTVTGDITVSIENLKAYDAGTLQTATLDVDTGAVTLTFNVDLDETQKLPQSTFGMGAKVPYNTNESPYIVVKGKTVTIYVDLGSIEASKDGTGDYAITLDGTIKDVNGLAVSFNSKNVGVKTDVQGEVSNATDLIVT